MRLVNCGCGGEAEIDCHLGDLNRCNLYYVYCHKCRITSANYHSEAEAVTVWNQAMSGFVNDMNVVSKVAKVLNQERISRYKFGSCEACGAPVIKPDKYCSECGAKLDWSDDE